MSSGALEASVTLEEVFAVVGSKRVPLAPELAGYLALEIAERADAEFGDLDPKSVFVSEEGTVALVKPRREVAIGDTESSIRAALARLLEASGSQTPALAVACKRRSGAGLQALAQELEAALIPVNRAAGRRALARLARETKRVTLGVGRHTLPSSPDSPLRAGGRAQASPPRASPPARFSREEDATTTRKRLADQLLESDPLVNQSELPTTQFQPSREPSPSQADVDDLIADFAVSGGGEQIHARELKALVGIEATPPPPARLRQPESRRVAKPGSVDTDIEALLQLGHDPSDLEGSSPLPSSASGAAMGSARPGEQRGRFDPRQLPTQPSQLRQSRAAPPKSRAGRPRGGWWTALGVGLLALAAGSYAVSQLQPSLFRRGASGPRTLKPNPIDGASRSASTLQPPLGTSSTPSCNGTLVVTDVPSRAEVLLRVGQAPVDVERMPVGARLEFVATADGYAAKRVVVPSGANWEPGPDGKPRFEATAQLEPSGPRPGVADRWPPGEPGSAVGGRGPAGTVHLVTSPRGAEIWMLAGMGPEARIGQLSCEREIDVLVAGPATVRNRLHVAPSDFVLEDGHEAATGGHGGARLARISAK